MTGFTETAGAGKFGLLNFSSAGELEKIAHQNNMTKIVLLKSGSMVSVDFDSSRTTGDEIYFLRPNQYLQLGEECHGSMLYYNDKLYFADLEDQELLYGGVLFSSVAGRLTLNAGGETGRIIHSFFEALKSEIYSSEINQEPMIRSLIKQLIIISTRAWEMEHGRQASLPIDPDFSRLFDRLVEQHYRTHHTVASYAKMLNITPKALSIRFLKCGNILPSEVIRKRIVLEAKRMLVHTPLTVKEVAYKLGYDDPCYFIRFFTKQVNMAPQTFRRYFQTGLSAVA
ncbi:helix-turn-helix domain-containing protein [Pedobacter sp.]|uniref:helix-turn-helix domain-containing protein n=1 Tax=Pedobacter sp. TaxID=1411316 RepID=UPI003C4B3502